MKSLALLVLCLPTLTTPQELSGRQLINSFVLTQKDAYFVAPPRLVSSIAVGGVIFSPKGQSALILGGDRQKVSGSGWIDVIFRTGKPISVRPVIQFWDTKTDSVKELQPSLVSTLSDLSPESESISWVSPTVALITSAVPQQIPTDKTEKWIYDYKITKVDFGAGTSKDLISRRCEPGRFPTLLVSKLQPGYYLIEKTLNTTTVKSDLKTTFVVTKFDLNGSQVSTVSATTRGNAEIYEWTADSKHLLGKVSVYDKTTQKAKYSSIIFNLLNNTISETKEDLSMFQKQEEPELDFKITNSIATFGESKRVVPTLWLKNPKNPGPATSQVQVASDVNDCWMSPDLSNIAFLSHGKLFASEIVRMDLAAFAKAKEQAEISEALSNAKQVATAVMIYSADYDDAMPLKDGFSDSVMPYIKNQDLLNGFVYTYNGGPLSGLKDPATTEIGYSMTAGGKCVAFADGHVKYIKNP